MHMWKPLVGLVGLSLCLSGCAPSLEESNQFLRYAQDRSVYDSRYHEELVVYKKNENPSVQFVTQKDAYVVNKPTNDREKVLELLKLMKLTREGSQTSPVISAGVTLLDAKVQDDMITLNFDDSILAMPEENRGIVLKSIADTMKINFLSARTLRIEVKGQTVTDWGGVDLHDGVLLREES